MGVFTSANMKKHFNEPHVPVQEKCIIWIISAQRARMLACRAEILQNGEEPRCTTAGLQWNAATLSSPHYLISTTTDVLEGR